MDGDIERRLENPRVGSRDELRSFIRETQSLIGEYERQHYGDADPRVAGRIGRWRRRILEIIREKKQLGGAEDETTEELSKDGIDTLRLLNRQLQQAESNQQILERSTLKLIGLDYSCGDIEGAIVETRRKMQQGLGKERKERRNILIAFIFFAGVCFYILFDRIVRNIL